MAGRKLGHRNNGRSIFPKQAAGFYLISMILCVSQFGEAASEEPLPQEPSQWKSSIERPTRGWDYDGKRILGHVGKDICLWDATTGELLHQMKGHKERIQAVQFSPDGNHALSSSWMDTGPVSIISRDTRTILWNLGTGRERDSFDAQVAGEFSPNGRHIVTYSQRPSEIKPEWGESTLPATGEVWPRGIAGSFDIAVWDAFTGRQLVKVKLDEGSDPYRDTLHFSPDGRSFVHITTQSAVLYNSSDGRETGRAAPRFGRDLRYTSNGVLAFFESSLTDQKFKLTDIKSGREIRSIEHSGKSTNPFVWAHDGSKVVEILSDGAMKILDIESGIMTIGAEHGPYPRPSAIASPDNRRLAVVWSGGERDTFAIGIYEMNTSKKIVQAKLPELASMVGFSPDSKTLLIAGSEFVIYDAETGEKIRTLDLRNEADSGAWDE